MQLRGWMKSLLKPVWSGEDDRYFGFSVHLKYGLHWRCSDAEQRLKTYEKYEDIDYSDDEYELELAKQLLDIPEVKAKWMKMHGKSDDNYTRKLTGKVPPT